MDQARRNRHDVTRVVIFGVAVFAAIAHGTPVRAVDLDNGDVGTRFSAKIAKERTRATTMQQLQERRDRRDFGNDTAGAECGSQNIGNVQTNGRIGSQPREVFVYAPNSVNVVTRGGCR